MSEILRRADASTVRVVDGLVAFWLVLWVVIGAWVGYSVWELAALGDTITTSGRTLDSAGQALTGLGGLPVVGDDSRALGEEVRANAAEIVARGRETGTSLRRLSVLLGVTALVVALGPVLVSYLPARRRRRREVRAVRRALRRPDSREAAVTYLAWRAVTTVPLDDLTRLAGDPEGELSRADVERLARAELVRLGVPLAPGSDR